MFIAKLILWELFIYLAVRQIGKLTNCFKELNIFTVFTLAIALRESVLVPLYENANTENAGFDVAEFAITRLYISIAIMYVGIILGILFVRKLVFVRPDVTNTIADIRQKIRQDHTYLNPIFWSIFIICWVIFLAYIWVVPEQLSLLLGADSTAETYKNVRVQYGEMVSYDQGIMYRIANTAKIALMPMMIYTLYFWRKKSRLLRGVFITFLLLAIGLVSITAHKAPVVYLLIGLFIANRFERSHSAPLITKKELFLAFSVVVVVLMGAMPLLYIGQYPQFTYLEGIELSLYRAFGETTRTLVLHFHCYPEMIPHLYGLSSSIISSLIGFSGESLDPGTAIPRLLFGPNSGTTWGALFIGGAWADFGYVGVFAFSFFVGSLFYYYYWWFNRSKKTGLDMGLYISLILASTYLCESNLLTNLFTNGLLLSFLVYKLISLDRLTNPALRQIKNKQVSRSSVG